MKLADGNLQHRVTQKHVTSIAVRVFQLSMPFRKRSRIGNVTLLLPNVLYGCKMWYPSLEVECAAVQEKHNDLG